MSQNCKNLLRNEITDDILQTIPDKSLTGLRDLFKNKWPYAAQAYHFVDHWIAWKKKDPNAGIRFTSPEGQWQDGTFIAIITEFTYNVYIFSFDTNCSRLSQSLKKTKLIDWNQGPFIFAIHEQQEKGLINTIRELSVIEYENESSIWMLSKEKALQFDIQCPEDMHIKPLNKNHSKLINSLWPHAFPDSDDYIANLIAHNGGFGLFTKKENKLISWISMNEFGALAFLQTVNEYKKKGYATLLVKLITKTLAENNKDSIAYILKKNKISQIFFTSIGFKFNNFVRWIQYKNINNLK